MSADKEQRLQEWSQTAAFLTNTFPDARALGNLLMLYGAAVKLDCSPDELVDCFGQDQCDMMERACDAAFNLWELRHGDDE